MNIEKILATTGAIYDTALEPNKWQEALDQTIDNIGAKVAMVSIVDANLPEVQLIAASSQYVDHYLEYVQFMDDPREHKLLRYISGLPSRTVWHDTDVMDMEALRALPSAQWVMKTVGVFHRCGVMFCEHQAWLDALVCGYATERQNITAEEEKILQLLLPHFARAVEIQRPLSILRQRFNAVMSVLDHFHVGVAILFKTGTVVLHNREAERIFTADDGLALNPARKIVIRQPDGTERLHSIIDKVVATANMEGDYDGESMVIPRASDAAPYVLEVVPLRDNGMETGESLYGAMLFVVDPERTDRVSTEGLAMAYRLSAAEQEVCLHIINGLKNDEIADIRGVGLETVKSQVKNILGKTRTRTRTELVHLAVKVSPPIDRKS